MKYLTLALLLSGFSASRTMAATGIAELKGTASPSPTLGIVLFEDTPKGLKVTATFANIPAGKHAFHIHEFGLCGDMGKAAGAHYNPMNTPHGHIMKDGAHKAHAGDLGNVKAAVGGKPSLDVVVEGITLADGPHSVGGRSVILHEKVDDFSQPAGNAGDRIACGTILVTGSGPSAK